MSDNLEKSFVIPAKFRTVTHHGSCVPAREQREMMKLVETPAPKFNAAMLFNHTEPRSGPHDIVKGLFGSDTTSEDNWAQFLKKTFASATNELYMRKAILEKALGDKLIPEVRLALYQRSINYYRDLQKSRVQIVTPDDLKKGEAKGGNYVRRVQTEKGGYRYYYDEEKYKNSRHHQVTGDEAAKTYLSKTLSSMVEKSGTEGCGPESMKPLVKKYGAKKVGDVLRESCEGGHITYKGGKFYAKAKPSEEK